MPAIAQKAKALSGKGVVLSYVDKPDNFYWREQVPGTKRYLHRLLPNANTIEEALEECIEAMPHIVNVRIRRLVHHRKFYGPEEGAYRKYLFDGINDVVGV